MKLTKAEKELILKKRAEEEANKPKKKGYLKHDLYDSSRVGGSIEELLEKYRIFAKKKSYFHSLDDLKEFLEAQKHLLGVFSDLSEIQPTLQKGTEFDCYIADGEELWYDSVGYGIEEAPKSFAERHLENIEAI